MIEFVKKGIGMYEDAIAYQAIATWDESEDAAKKADVAWSRYEGARTLLSMMFPLSDKDIDMEMELLLTEKIL